MILLLLKWRQVITVTAYEKSEDNTKIHVKEFESDLVEGSPFAFFFLLGRELSPLTF